LKPVNFDRWPFQVMLAAAVPPGSVRPGASAMNIRVEIRAGEASPAASVTSLPRTRICSPSASPASSCESTTLSCFAIGTPAHRHADSCSAGGAGVLPGRKRTARSPAMSWTTVGVFSFWPTSSRSPGCAFGWLALTTRFRCDGRFHGRPSRGTRSSASPKVTTAWWRWWLIAWRQGARASSSARPAFASTASASAASSSVASTLGE
jgi:hypothetical protein